jgi:hypothetical protein
MRSVESTFEFAHWRQITRQHEMASHYVVLRCWYADFAHIAPRDSMLESNSGRRDKLACKNCKNGRSSKKGPKSSGKKSESTSTFCCMHENTTFSKLMEVLNVKFRVEVTAHEKSQNWWNGMLAKFAKWVSVPPLPGTIVIILLSNLKKQSLTLRLLLSAQENDQNCNCY